ncbi:hypothetical protein [Sporosarcina sp. USHLN248]|uniref:hypothetical protein n=1 Tax=Sporosarcina sp. USHLN248 TaxID=3081300 RepID=UPI0030193C97
MSHPLIPNLTTIQSTNSSSSPLVLREGQMFHGQIKQLFPGQMAEVQIGGQRLIAKLEVPMKAGDSYYFQVKSTEPELQLKMISGPLRTDESLSRQLSSLLESMQLPKTSEMQSLLNYVLKQKLPISRDNLLEAEKLLKTVPAALRNEALSAIHKLLDMRLPLTINHFNSLIGVETREGLHHLIAALSKALNNENALSEQAKSHLSSLLNGMGKQTDQAVERSIIANALNKLLETSVGREERFAVLQLLKQAGVLPIRTSLANLPSVIHEMMGDIPTQRDKQSNEQQLPSRNNALLRNIFENASPTVHKVIQDWAAFNGKANIAEQAARILASIRQTIENANDIPAKQKTELLNALHKLSNASTASLKESPEVRQISVLIAKLSAVDAVLKPFQSSVFLSERKTQDHLHFLSREAADQAASIRQLAQQSSSPIVKDIMQSAQAAVDTAIDGKIIREAMRSIITSMGFNYEASLAGKEADFDRLSAALKPQLILLSQDQSVSPQLREVAEQLLFRMNGPMMQSGEVGHNQQIVMQLPLEFLGKRIDATLQWNGRMKEDGKIDADYARILFYLDLQSLEKTIVDMVVQNRIISITVFNADESIKQIGMPIVERLKKGLSEIDYQFSGIFFKNFEEHGKKASERSNKRIPEREGVDFRI